MHYMGLNEIRESFLSFFESKEHKRLPSYPLIPINDKSLLLINSGMAPMKKFFTGEEVPPKKRVTTCQKCIRTPDLESVGKTARHGTYFEMLGNFSFGDYFKRESLSWAWEYLTKVLEIPENLLWPSIYEKDEEAYEIWRDVIGVDETHIVRLGKGDNFWEHGTGPCGPCSEIYFDRGEKYGCGSPDCKPGCDCDRYMEIWNNVFSQFDNDGKGNYSELKQKNIDTGMGLERLACVMQGVDNIFEVDTIRNILDAVCEISGKKYGENHKNDVSIRIITDHIRSSSFMISDGVIPSNEGRGYVLRRILRRAARNGKLLGINRPFLTELCDIVIEDNGKAYPELSEKADYVKKVISIEEERFDRTLDAGLNILSDICEKAKKDGKTAISGDDAFRLYDTFGFPSELTVEIASEQGLEVDSESFNALMKEQRVKARSARANISGWSDASKTALGTLEKTEFTGYSELKTASKVVAIFVDDESVESVSEGDCTVVLAATPFYGEGGGQVGDIGSIYSDSVNLIVTDTKKTDGVYLHLCTIKNGILKKGDTVTAEIDGCRRDAIRRNHSSAHLLQAALRSVLGNHVEQAGSYVDEGVVRFDFTHFSAMTTDEIKKVEEIVNREILAAHEISTKVEDIEQAKKEGAMALFGEKYGKTVRVVKMGDFSTELCGGTHMDNTSRIGLFKIISESSVAAGTRRIEGVTGKNVLTLLDGKDARLSEVSAVLKTNEKDVVHKAEALLAENKAFQKEIGELNSKISLSRLDDIVKNAEEINGMRVITAQIEAKADILRNMSDAIREKYDDSVSLLAAVDDGKVILALGVGKAAQSKAHAGKLIKEAAAVCGGGGGGRPDSATAGGKDATKINDAFAKIKALVSEL